MAICGIKLIDLTNDAIAIFGYTFFLHSKIVNRTKYLPLTTSFPEQLVGGRWSIPQNFFLAFTDELEKQRFIKKT